MPTVTTTEGTDTQDPAEGTAGTGRTPTQPWQETLWDLLNPATCSLEGPLDNRPGRRGAGLKDGRRRKDWRVTG